MVQGKVEICGVNTAKLPLLKAADKDALFAKIREGDTAARETYIEGNLRLVLSVIKRFSSSAENVDDLFQIGCIGLIKAIDNFDATLGVKFSTYAVPMIIGEIRRFLRDNNSIRVSRSLKDTAYKAIYAKDTLTRKNLKEPTVEEIAAALDMEPDKVRELLQLSQEPISLETPVGEEEDAHLEDFIQDEDAGVPVDEAGRQLLRRELLHVLKSLTPREERVITLRFGLEDGRARTLEELGKEFNVTRERVRQIEAKALRKLRHPSRAKLLRDYLDE